MAHLSFEQIQKAMLLDSASLLAYIRELKQVEGAKALEKFNVAYEEAKQTMGSSVIDDTSIDKERQILLLTTLNYIADLNTFTEDKVVLYRLSRMTELGTATLVQNADWQEASSNPQAFNVCILHNLQYCDFVSETIKCKNCGTAYSLECFLNTRTDIITCKGCNQGIDSEGNVVQNSQQISCCRCNAEYIVGKDKSSLCPGCRQAVDEKEKFFAILNVLACDDMMQNLTEGEGTAELKLKRKEAYLSVIPTEELKKGTKLSDWLGDKSQYACYAYILEHIEAVLDKLFAIYTYYTKGMLNNLVGIVGSTEKGAINHYVYTIDATGTRKQVQLDSNIAEVAKESMKSIAKGYSEMIYAGTPNDKVMPFGSARDIKLNLTDTFGVWGSLHTLGHLSADGAGKYRHAIGVPGVHLPYIFGYAYDETGRLTKYTDETIAFAKGDLRNRFFEAITDYIFENRSKIKFDEGTLLDFVDAYESAMELALSDGSGEFAGPLKAILKTVTLALLKRLSSFAVVRFSGAYDVFFDIICGAIYTGNKVQEVSVGERATELINYNVFKTASTTTTTGGILFNGVSNVPELKDYVYSIYMVSDADKKLAMPNFAYIPVNKLKKKGKYSTEKFVIGETLDGGLIEIDGFVKDKHSMSIFASSRAGKGVLTLTMLGNILGAENLAVTYADFKPDMSCVLTEFEVRLRAAVTAINQCAPGTFKDDEKPHFISNEYKASYATAKTDSKALYNTMSKQGQLLIETRQRNWLQGGLPAFEQSVRDVYGVKCEGTFFSLSLYRYIMYIRHIMLMYALSNIQKASDGTDFDPLKICAILDEVNNVQNDYASQWVESLQSNLGISIEVDKELEKQQKAKAQQLKKDSKNDVATTEQSTDIEEVKATMRNPFCQWLRNYTGDFAKKYVQNSESCDLLLGAAENLNGFITLGNAVDRAEKPSFIIIGQNYKQMVTPIGTSKTLAPIGWLLDNLMKYRIQGNWVQGSLVPDDDDVFKPTVTKDLRSDKAIEDSELMHVYDENNPGKSGFFAIRDGLGTPKLFNSYFVLNANTSTFTEGASNNELIKAVESSAKSLNFAVRARYKKALDGSTNIYGVDRVMDTTLSKLLYDVTDGTVPDVALVPTEQDANNMANYILRLDNSKGIKRKPEAGFYGYIKLATGKDYLLDSNGTDEEISDIATLAKNFAAKSADEQKEIVAYIRSMIDSYKKLEARFKSLAIYRIAVEQGWTDKNSENPIEDFLYCPHVSSFVTLGQMALSDTPDNCEKLRKALKLSAKSTGTTQTFAEVMTRGTMTDTVINQQLTVPTNTNEQQAEIEKACAEIKSIAETIYKGVEMGIAKGSVTQAKKTALTNAQVYMNDQFNKSVLATIDESVITGVLCYQQLMNYLTTELGSKINKFNKLPTV